MKRHATRPGRNGQGSAPVLAMHIEISDVKLKKKVSDGRS